MLDESWDLSIISQGIVICSCIMLGVARILVCELFESSHYLHRYTFTQDGDSHEELRLTKELFLLLHRYHYFVDKLLHSEVVCCHGHIL